VGERIGQSRGYLQKGGLIMSLATFREKAEGDCQTQEKGRGESPKPVVFKRRSRQDG